MEKNKLYHRTMDGHGVVCGLKLTCDCHCKGHILIHEGFAIDDCGNDLVVCETTRFDVIGALRKNGLLVGDEPEDECAPKHRKSRCEIKQCFYVTICYDEEVSGYETPFQSSCTAGPKECLPTRTHERVRFDVTDKLPPSHSYLMDLEKRIKECFEMHCEGPLGRIMKKYVKEMQYIIEGGAATIPAALKERGLWMDPCDLFCELRAYFLNHLKVKPDEFNCNLLEEVSCLTCPREYAAEYRKGQDTSTPKSEQKEWLEHYRAELNEAFRKLLFYMERYQFDCVFGDLIFSCPQPRKAHCLVLGTVEVLDGKLIRVCNTPRDYRWTPANLIQVLTYSIMTGRLIHNECETAHCCPDYPNFEPTTFLKEFELSECGRYYAAKSTIDAFRAVSRSLHHSFDFTHSAAISHLLFENAQALRDEEEFLGIRISSSETNPSSFGIPTVLQALQSYALKRPGDSVIFYKTAEGKIARVLPNFVTGISPDPTIGEKIDKLVNPVKRPIVEKKKEGPVAKPTKSEPTKSGPAEGSNPPIIVKEEKTSPEGTSTPPQPPDKTGGKK